MFFFLSLYLSFRLLLHLNRVPKVGKGAQPAIGLAFYIMIREVRALFIIWKGHFELVGFL